VTSDRRGRTPDAGPSVCLDARFVGYAGVGRMVSGLWSGLVELGANVTGLWPEGAPGDWMGAHRASPPGLSVPVAARPFMLAEQITLPRVLRRLDIAVHHAPFFAVPYLSRTPVVLTVHDLFPYVHPGVARSFATAAAYRVLIPAALRRAQMIVAVSAYAADELRSAFDLGDGQVRVIEHGLDRRLWTVRSDEAIERMRQHYGLPERYLLYVGTLKPHKNLVTLLRALGPEHPTLVLAGATATELGTSDLPASAGEIVALGRVSDDVLATLYAGAQALLLPSLYESVGFTALEAMACGAPVVCSDGGGLPATVGDAGVVVPARDVAAWRETLTRIGRDDGLRRRMTGAGLERTRHRSWRTAAEGYLEVYREAAA
jgi:glycosyltransferase involved in cell wall biosynthesis